MDAIVGESTNHVCELTRDVGELCHAGEIRLSTRTNDPKNQSTHPKF